MNSLDILSRERDYEQIAASRGVRDAQGVAGETIARLWQKERDGVAVTVGIEGLVLNGFIIDALRREKNETPAPAALDPEREPYPPLPRPVPGLDASLFARSLRESLLAMPRKKHSPNTPPPVLIWSVAPKPNERPKSRR